jgi:hypothetical protein
VPHLRKCLLSSSCCRAAAEQAASDQCHRAWKLTHAWCQLRSWQVQVPSKTNTTCQARALASRLKQQCIMLKNRCYHTKRRRSQGGSPGPAASGLEA